MDIESKYRVPKIIAPHERAPSWLRIVLLLAILAIVGWYGYQLGGSAFQGGIVGFKPSAEQKIKSLEEEREELRRQLTMLQQAAQVDQEAIRAIKEQIKTFQDERLKMEEELAFLRGIVSTSSNKTGLKIQNFKIEPGIEDRQYSYKFSVSQVINSGTVAKGTIHIRLEGLQDGHSKVLGLESLTNDKRVSHKMRFRYFQNVEGKLKLPAEFVPASLTIEVKPVGNKLAPVTETFDWLWVN